MIELFYDNSRTPPKRKSHWVETVQTAKLIPSNLFVKSLVSHKVGFFTSSVGWKHCLTQDCLGGCKASVYST